MGLGLLGLGLALGPDGGPLGPPLGALGGPRGGGGGGLTDLMSFSAWPFTVMVRYMISRFLSSL